MNLTADISVLFSDLGTPATIGGVPVRGLMDVSSTEVLDENGRVVVLATRRTFRIPTGSVSGLKDGLSAVIAGTTYKTLRVRPDDGDGLITIMDLQG